MRELPAVSVLVPAEACSLTHAVLSLLLLFFLMVTGGDVTPLSKAPTETPVFLVEHGLTRARQSHVRRDIYCSSKYNVVQDNDAFLQCIWEERSACLRLLP